MSGICIIISGRSGSGKTTFIKEVVTSDPLHIEYMTSYVTRHPRPNDYGYVYVTKDEYNNLRSESKIWDHFEMYNEYYGTDVEKLLAKAATGKNILISCYPTIEELRKITTMYTLPTKSIFIDVSSDTSLQTIKNERQGHELERVKIEDEIINQETLSAFDYIFKPEGNLDTDIPKFIKLVKDILEANR